MGINILNWTVPLRCKRCSLNHNKNSFSFPIRFSYRYWPSYVRPRAFHLFVTQRKVLITNGQIREPSYSRFDYLSLFFCPARVITKPDGTSVKYNRTSNRASQTTSTARSYISHTPNYIYVWLIRAKAYRSAGVCKTLWTAASDWMATIGGARPIYVGAWSMENDRHLGRGVLSIYMASCVKCITPRFEREQHDCVVELSSTEIQTSTRASSERECASIVFPLNARSTVYT